MQSNVKRTLRESDPSVQARWEEAKGQGIIRESHHVCRDQYTSYQVTMHLFQTVKTAFNL